MPLDEATRARIQSLIDDNEVMLFMKGHREAPQCGFSARVVQMLDQCVADYQTFDVLGDGGLREGIKEFSSWPTIPQLYVRGEFIGGCDIVTELFETGELLDTFGIELGEAEAPDVDISDAAAQRILESLRGAPPEQSLHLAIDARYQARLFVTEPDPNGLHIEVNGVVLHFDPLSAVRANRARIDLIETERGMGFQVHLPEAPEPAA